MRDWIVGLLKAASERQDGAKPEDLTRLEQELEVTLPEELRELYTAVAGADFQGDVSLYPLFADEEVTGVLEQSQEDLQGLPSRGVLRFGLRGGAEHLFAVKHSEMKPLLGDTGGWIAAVPADGWIFGVKNLDTGGVRFFRNLEVMLSELVPPAQTEGFGENTFIRAFNAVQSAIETASGDSAEGEEQPRAKSTSAVDSSDRRSNPADKQIDSRPIAATQKPKAATATKKASPAGGRAAARSATPAVKKPAAAKKPASRKAAAGKKAPAKKAPAKAGSRTSAKRKKSTARRAAAAKAAPKKSTGKRAAPKKSAKRGASKKAAPKSKSTRGAKPAARKSAMKAGARKSRR